MPTAPVDDLALQVGQRNRIVIDDAEGARTGSGQIKQRRRAKPAGTDYENAGLTQAHLTGTADLRQHDVARVTLKLVVAETHGTRA